MEDCKIARQVAESNPQGNRRRGRPVSTWKDGVRNGMQRRNLQDGECFDRELWRMKIMSSGRGKLCTHRKIFTFTSNVRLIFCGSVYDALSSSDYIASNVRMIDELE
jgi:hypothetical protein